MTLCDLKTKLDKLIEDGYGKFDIVSIHGEIIQFNCMQRNGPFEPMDVRFTAIDGSNVRFVC